MVSVEDRKLARPWMVSLHGGHSNSYCDHASDSLRDILDAAIEVGYHAYGVTEHVPRFEDQYLYPNEKALGWTTQKTIDDFERYIIEMPGVAADYNGRLRVIRGFESEVVPTDKYAGVIDEYRNRRDANGDPVFEFFVGSVHHLYDLSIDGDPEDWKTACNIAGSPSRLAEEYYNTVKRMVELVRPDVIGHLDLIKRNCKLAGVDPGDLISDSSIRAAEAALDSIKRAGSILDLNTAGFRKGLGEPYPGPWLMERAQVLGIPFCFGDDSHCIDHVGSGIEDGRQYLLENGIDRITLPGDLGEGREERGEGRGEGRVESGEGREERGEGRVAFALT